MEALARTAVAECVLVATREDLRRRWRLAEQAPRPVRLALAQATRMIAEITVGRGTRLLLGALDRLGRRLAELDPAAAALLTASLSEFRAEWVRHATEGTCAAGVCFEPHVAPCRAACPADIDIPGFLAHIGHGHYDDALRVIAKDNPLPHSCGLVCPAPCEDACLRGTTGSALFIRPLKAVAARESGRYGAPAKAAATGKRIAVVGSGPAGLTVAYYLAVRGHRVEIFEAREQAGGMLRYGIPSYRLPYDVLDAEIDHIKSLGVLIHTGRDVGSVADLRAQGFDASYLAIGLQLSRRLGIEGDHFPFVVGGMDFLGGVGAGENPQVGPRVIVIGGGNSAVDAAMTALRQGARQVSMVYRGRRGEMRASPHEIALAVAEGVEILELWMPERVLPDNRMVFRRSPKATEAELRESGEFLTLAVDHVLVGIGQEAALSCLAGSRVEIRSGHIVADPVTAATAEPGIYAGGDVAHGASTVVAAVRAGKAAAASIHAYVMGEAPSGDRAGKPRLSAPLVATGAARRSVRLRPPMPQRDAGKRKATYEPIELGLAEADAQAEAGRCLRCDLCIGCGLCELVCSEVGAESLRMVETSAGRLVFDDFTRPAGLCIGCGACAAICPTGAIRTLDQDGTRSTVITGTVVRRQAMLSCALCRQPLVTDVQFRLVGDLLAHGDTLPLLCPSCAQTHNVPAVDSVAATGK